jgi:hypothetical protein
MKIALLALALAAAAAVATLFGAKRPLLGVFSFFLYGMTWVLWLSPQEAPLRGRSPARIGAWLWRRVKGPAAKRPARRSLDTSTLLQAFDTSTLQAFWGFPILSMWMIMIEGNPYDPLWLLMVVVLLFGGFHLGAACATDWAVDRVARRRAPATKDAGRGSWEAEHPWRAALFEIWSLPLASLALILFFPAPLGLRVAFAVFLVAVTALLAVGLCLNRSLQEQGAYARSLE